MVALTGHNDPVNQLVFAPDGRILASTGDDGCVWLWDVVNRVALARLSWGAKWTFGVAFSPDGHTLAVGTEDAVLLLREENGSWKPFHQSREHQSWVTAVSFAPDGQLLATGSADGTVRLWDADQRRKRALRVINAGLGAVRSVAFAPGGLAVAAGGATGVGMWTAVDHEPIVFHRLPDSDVRSVAFTPDAQVVLAAAGRAVLQVDLVSLQVTPLPHGGPSGVRCLATASNGNRALTGHDDGSVQLWDTIGGTHQSFPWHGGAVNCVAFSPDVRIAASAGDDFCVCVWDIS